MSEIEIPTEVLDAATNELLDALPEGFSVEDSALIATIVAEYVAPLLFQAGREAAARALLTCVRCGKVHEYRDVSEGRHKRWTWADPDDGHAYWQAATKARGESGGNDALARLVRGPAAPHGEAL